MQIIDLLRQRMAAALQRMADESSLSPSMSSMSADEIASYANMVRPTTDSRHGDYQANCAMPMAKAFGSNPRGIADQVVTLLSVADICEPPAIAGPGFINLRLRDDYLTAGVATLLNDSRLGVTPIAKPQTVVIDYSGPNVAKPMHVGHIRSTVIGDALASVLRFLGDRVITDNHLGDWGTQFGMIIYGYKHFGDDVALQAAPVAELSRLYRLVNRLIEYHASLAGLSAARDAVDLTQSAVELAQRSLAAASDPKLVKPAEKLLHAAQKKLQNATEQWEKLTAAIAAIKGDPAMNQVAESHAEIRSAVLEETAKLHEGDVANLELWQRFLPACKDEINRVYARLKIKFDYTLGESFYHPQLPGVVAKLRADGLAVDSDGAVCVFMPEFDSPMIVQKRDGAFLYATTDLATLEYRREQFAADEILYVVDSRQSEHFEKLFAVAKKMGFSATRLVHVQFGTVLGSDGKPFKTRSGTSIGLESLLDDAVARALAVVCDPGRTNRIDPPLTDAEQQEIASVVGHGAIKYADLSHHRSSDYKFDLEKMVALDGNTSAYVQYAYARVQGILTRGNTTETQIRQSQPTLLISHSAERAMMLQLLRLGESLEQVRADYAPNFLVDYLYETAKLYAVFNDACPVLKADDASLVSSRLALVAATGQVIRTGLQLLGIDVVTRM